MEKGFLSWNITSRISLLIMFVLMIGVGYAAEDWASINNGSDPGEQDVSGNNVNNSQSTNDGFVISDDEVSGNSLFNIKYTSDFYIAAGLGVLGILIVALFIYLFIRGPKNKWKDA